jgi:hypothetical protein
MPDPVLVEVVRGTLVESRHRGAVAVVDADGESRLALGDVDAPVYPRSAIKAFQALPLVLSGAADRYGFGDEELALACASHGGEPGHLAASPHARRRRPRRGRTGRFVTEMMEMFGPRLFIKIGAEGVMCAALPGEGLGFAIKCDDGARRGADRGDRGGGERAAVADVGNGAGGGRAARAGAGEELARRGGWGGEGRRGVGNAAVSERDSLGQGERDTR